MGETLPNHSYVDLSALGELDNVDDHVVCHTDLTTCCGGYDCYDRGYWYFPNEDVLPGAGYDSAAANPNTGTKLEQTNGRNSLHVLIVTLGLLLSTVH